MHWSEEIRVCALDGCEKKFLPEQHNQKYCCEAHKQAAENARWYARHREQRIAQVIERRKKRR